MAALPRPSTMATSSKGKHVVGDLVPILNDIGELKQLIRHTEQAGKDFKKRFKRRNRRDAMQEDKKESKEYQALKRQLAKQRAALKEKEAELQAAKQAMRGPDSILARGGSLNRMLSRTSLGSAKGEGIERTSSLRKLLKPAAKKQGVSQKQSTRKPGAPTRSNSITKMAGRMKKKFSRGSMQEEIERHHHVLDDLKFDTLVSSNRMTDREEEVIPMAESVPVQKCDLCQNPVAVQCVECELDFCTACDAKQHTRGKRTQHSRSPVPVQSAPSIVPPKPPPQKQDKSEVQSSTVEKFKPGFSRSLTQELETICDEDLVRVYMAFVTITTFSESWEGVDKKGYLDLADKMVETHGPPYTVPQAVMPKTTKVGFAKLFHSADFNYSGSIEAEEFLLMMHQFNEKAGHTAADQKLLKIFNEKMDSNRDGVLTFSEFCTFIEKYEHKDGLDIS